MKQRERVAELRRHLPEGAAVQDDKFEEGPRDLNAGDMPLAQRPFERTLHQTRAVTGRLSLYVREEAKQGLSHVHRLARQC